MPSLLDLRRTVAALVAVALAATIVAFSLLITDTFRAQVQSDARASVGDADIVVLPAPRDTSTDGFLPVQATQQVDGLDGVASARPYAESMAWLDRPGSAFDSHAFVLALPELGGGTRLTSGRLPRRAGEVAISPELATSGNLRPGDAVGFVSSPADGTSTNVTVVGVLQPGPDVSRRGGAAPFVFVSPDQDGALALPATPSVLYVAAQAGTSTTSLMGEVADVVHALQPGASLYTADEIVSMRTSSMPGGSVTQTILSLLTPVCAVIAAIVVATTFTTLVAHQTRQTGLLRCVGASRRQIMASVLRSALLTGLIGSALGAVCGTAAAVLVIRSGLVDGLDARHLTITWTAATASLLLGTLVTLVAAVRPALRASRASPLVALTGRTACDRRLGRRRVLTAGVGLLGCAAGGVLAGLGVGTGSVGTTAVAAVVLGLGTLLALPLLVLGAARLVERTGGGGRHAVRRLAARNLARDPGRAAATTASLLVCVAVGATVVTGLSCVSTSMDAYVSASAPIDIRVQAIPADASTQQLSNQVGAVDRVETVAVVPELTVAMTSPAHEEREITLHAVDEHQVADVVRSGVGLEGLDDATLVLGGIFDVPEGTPVTLTGSGGSASLTVHVEEGGFGPVITPAVAHQLLGESPSGSALWARTSGDGSDRAPGDQVRELLHGSGLVVDTAAAGRTSFAAALDRAVAVTLLVLGLTLFMSLSSLANTTDVSVLERVREIGVLRATGAQRSQVRRLFLTESVLMAGLGGLLGVVMGGSLGVAGAGALLTSDSGSFLTVDVPWLTLAAVLAVAGAVGALASLRPAGRASRVTPVSALAGE